MFPRISKPLLSNSFLLLGGRGVGKSTLVSGLLPAANTLKIDLLDPVEEERFATHPNEFRELVLAHKQKASWVFVDEIQRCPKLLNLIHQLIESDGIRFALTGSSARKLRRGAANLLAGRAFLNYLFPLTHLEVGGRFLLEDVLKFGSLPKVFALESAEEKKKFLQSYVATFVQEEVKAEQIVRNLDPFRRFLEVAAQCNGKVLNYANIGRDVGVDIKTVQSYYQVLDDTLIGFFVEPFHTSVRKSIGHKPKFYLFDLGVQRSLAKQLTVDLAESTAAFGELFEAFIICEFYRLNAYYEKDFSFSFLMTKDDVEIDLVISRPGKKTLLIEIKSTREVRHDHLAKFLSLGKDIQNSEMICICREERSRQLDGITLLPWRLAFQSVFDLPPGTP